MIKVEIEPMDLEWIAGEIASVKAQILVQATRMFVCIADGADRAAFELKKIDRQIEHLERQLQYLNATRMRGEAGLGIPTAFNAGVSLFGVYVAGKFHPINAKPGEVLYF